jgi:hypothetical protein
MEVAMTHDPHRRPEDDPLNRELQPDPLLRRGLLAWPWLVGLAVILVLAVILYGILDRPRIDAVVGPQPAPVTMPETAGQAPGAPDAAERKVQAKAAPREGAR